METLLAAHQKVERQGGLSKTISDVQDNIDLLISARDTVAADGSAAAMTLAKLKNPVKQTFEKLNQDIKEVHTALNNYTKALDKKFKNLALPTAANDPFSSHPTLTNRAVAMHLLREGQFGVAATFISEANAKPPQLPPADGGVAAVSLGENDIVMEDRSWAQDFAAISADVDAMDDGNYRQVTSSEPYGLQEKFAHMYEILQSLREKHDLQPAVRWAQSQSDALELRGSNLEFELCRLQFVELYQGRGFDGLPGIDHEDLDGPMRALLYARTIFPSFATRYLRETSALLGSLAYAPELTTSPYRHIFYNHDVWEEIASSFVREFCGLLGLSEKSPLYTAVTAGGIALPVLKKLESVMGEVGGQWTSANELPVEIPLPPSYIFHSIFVCPVSKEQSTDANPPMLMPCGHVIAKESLDKISRGNKFKCPYCPMDSHPRDAKKVFL